MSEEIEQKACKEIPTAELLRLERETEKCIKFMEQRFGTIGNPDYDNFRHYLKGLQSGIRTTMRIMDM